MLQNQIYMKSNSQTKLLKFQSEQLFEKTSICKSRNNIKFVLALLFVMTINQISYSQTFEGINTGSKIINMGPTTAGGTTQTVANGLKPYGLVYSLLKTFRVPVKWVISSTKAHGGIDFSHNSIDYRGGTFIIPVEFITPAVTSEIAVWTAKGVRVNTTVSPIIVEVYRTLTVAPNWTLNSENTSIATPFWTNAEIPTTSYNTIAPSALSACNDIFVMPHADPTWAVHSNIYNWNQTHKGAIWEACHAISVFENTVNPVSPFQRMNFLMQDPPGAPSAAANAVAVPFGSHADGTPPYTMQYPSEPVMQFIGTIDAAQQNGSEQIFMPKVGYRPTTKIGVFDPSQANIPSLSPGPAATLAFGPGRGIATNGKVCAESGHDFNGTTASEVAAQRVFWNFSFWAAQDKAVIISNPIIPVTMVSGTSYPLSATISGGSGTYTYLWSSSCGGTFTEGTSASTSFTPPVLITGASPVNCTLTFRATDSCGRVGFTNVAVTVFPPAAKLPPVAIDNSAYTNVNAPVTFNITSNDFDPDGTINPATVDLDPATAGIQTTFTVSGQGTFTVNASGNVTFTPVTGFIGYSNIFYTVRDNETIPLTSNLAVISVTIRLAPTITCPGNITINCTLDPTNIANTGGNATAIADVSCPGAVTITYVDGAQTANLPTCASNYQFTRTWKATDVCGNYSTCDQIITVTDSTAPTGTAPAGTTNINACFIDATTVPTGTPVFSATSAAAGFTDNCSAIVTATLTNTAVTGTNCSWTATYTFKVSDACGNELTGQTISHTGGGTSPPTFASLPSASLIPYSSIPSFQQAVATDTCGSVTLTFNDVSTTPNCDGSYSITRTWTAKDDCNNTSTASQTINVSPAVFLANDDSGTTINGYVGGTSFTNILSNDTLDSNPITSSQVITSFISSTNPGVTLSGTNVVVAPGTPAGNYTLTYQICGVSATCSCATGVVTVPVTAAPIDAVDDSGTINGFTGGTAVANVLVNDTLNGAPVNAAQVNTTFVSSTNAGITLSGTSVNVAPGTPAGTYTLTYLICEILNPTNCDQAVVTVTVTPPAIVAQDDVASVSIALTGGTAFTNVLSNDTLNGVAVVPSEVNTTFISSSNPGITLSGTNVIVAPGTPAGSYTLVYQICEISILQLALGM